MNNLFGEEQQELRPGKKAGKRPYERVGKHYDSSKRCKHCRHMFEGEFNRNGKYVYCAKLVNRRTSYNREKTRPNYPACKYFKEIQDE